MVAEAVEQIKQVSRVLNNQPVILLFSTGKDSITMADLMEKHYSGKKEYVFFYFVDGLEIKERILQHYETKWNMKITRLPSYNTLNMKQNKKKIRFADLEHTIRKKLNITYISHGAKKVESMARRGMLAHLKYGILDERNYKLYPVADFNDKQVFSYCKLNKLQLPVEYNHGLARDFSVPDVDLLIYLRNTFPRDYEKVIEEFPQLEACVWGRENGS